MTDWAIFFNDQLQASCDLFVWAISQINPTWLDQQPPSVKRLGVWSPARHVWHVVEYERCVALPCMRQWLGGKAPTDTDWSDNDETWTALKLPGMDDFVAAFRHGREQQMGLLTRFSAEDWTTTHATRWGEKPLSMVVTKTIQHTYDHGNTLLRMGLWWADFLANE